MRRTVRALVFIAVGVAATAPAKEKRSFEANCNSIARSSTCQAFPAAEVAGDKGKKAKANCARPSTWSAGPCPARGQVGGCRDNRTGTETFFYSTGATAFTAAEAEPMCDPKYQQTWTSAKN